MKILILYLEVFEKYLILGESVKIVFASKVKF